VTELETELAELCERASGEHWRVLSEVAACLRTSAVSLETPAGPSEVRVLVTVVLNELARQLEEIVSE